MCISPIYIKNPRADKLSAYGEHLPVPCGHCVECLSNNISANLGRLLAQQHTPPYNTTCNIFVTLTIDDNIEPITPEHEGVTRRHIKSFQRALNKLSKKMEYPIHYFITSEYGSKNDRPHYHALLFGFKDIHQAEQFVHTNWKFGFVSFRVVDFASIRYSANSHISKSSHIPYRTLIDTYDDGTKFVYQTKANKPFTASSRHLGQDYIIQHMNEIYKDGVLHFDGMAFPLHPTAVEAIRRAHGLDSTALLWYSRKKHDLHKDRGAMYLGYPLEKLQKLKINYTLYEDSKSLHDAVVNRIQQLEREYLNTFITKKQL